MSDSNRGKFRKLRVETVNGVGYLLLDGGGRFNKLSLKTIKELHHAVVQLAEDPLVKVIVISGYPGESFAVGADISQMLNFSPVDAYHFSTLGQELFAAIEETPKPVIGALNGITMGGGCDLALSCDIRIAAANLKIAHPGARLGIITGFCGTAKLPRAVGKNFAREIFMASDPYNATEALHMGLVNRVCSCENFWPEVVSFAEKIARHPFQALAALKRLANAAEDTDLRSGCLLEQEIAGQRNSLHG